jgi:type I restriction enzyme S subunit
MSFPRYPKYKDSGVEWLGQVPEHWEVKRLKRACHVFPSNVDKKTHDGETSVLLCNYTDVYYNETITAGMDFMVATASTDQIAKFTLRAGDTIITKDSETADDIAIGAYVPADLPGVVCGYHLSMVRPLPNTDGAFVKRLFDSTYAKSCFEVSANGLTRVGLGQYELDNVELPFPPYAEQKSIAAFLNRETAKIDELVAEQQRLMELLKEKRQAAISQAVTKGLNPNATMKSSGIEWLGDVPAHWEVRRLKFICDVQTGDKDTENAVEEGQYPFFVRSQTVERIHSMSFDCEAVLTAGDGVGVGKVFHYYNGPFDFHQRVYMMNNFREVSGPFLFHFLRENFFKVALEGGAKSTVDSLRRPTFMNFPVCVPPKMEQEAIVKTVEQDAIKFDALTAEAQRAIDLLQERRTALISAAVTGQIDVRSITN